MAREYGGDIFDFDTMTDDEIRTVVRDHLMEYPDLDSDEIDVVVNDRSVTLSGRVGTDAEVQIAENVLDDVLGLDDYTNELVVDPLQRRESPEAADESATAEDEVDDQIGEPDSQQSDTAEHLTENLEAESFGTHDLGQSIRDGSTYVPPDRPTSDGYDSGEDH